MLFQPRQPHPTFQRSEHYLQVVCWCLWKEPVCWWWDEDEDLQTDRVTADAQWPPLAATAMQAVKCLVKFATALLMCSGGSSSPDALQGDFQLITVISRPRLQLEFILLFQHGASDVIVQQVQIWRVSVNRGRSEHWEMGNNIILSFSDIFQQTW